MRLSLALGRLPDELAEVLTAGGLAEYQALCELDGPWWGEREAAHLRQLCAIQSAAGGVSASPDEFAIEWTVGTPPAAADVINLVPFEDGIQILAAQYAHLNEAT